jgi:hypothetical protein
VELDEVVFLENIGKELERREERRGEVEAEAEECKVKWRSTREK